MLPVNPTAATPPALRQHPATSPEILAPYVPHGIEVEWFDQKGFGPYRAELEMVSRQRPYVVGHKQSRDTFTNLLPVLRPMASITVLGPLGNSLAVQVAKLLLAVKPEEQLTYATEPQSDGAVVNVTAQGRNSEPVRYCKVVLGEGDFHIQGSHGETWVLQNVLAAYELLRRHHIAVGLSADQYAVL